MHKILELIPELSVDEARAVMRMIEMQHPKVLQSRKLEREAELFYKNLAHYMITTLGITFPSPRDMEASGLYPVFVKSWKSIHTFMERIPLDSDSKKTILYRRMLALVIDYMRSRKIALTPYAVLLNLGKIPALVDSKFPGYQNLGKVGGELLIKDRT